MAQHAGLLVDHEAADRVRDGRHDVNREAAVGPLLDRSASRAGAIDNLGEGSVRRIAVEFVRIDDEPGSPPAAGDLLDETVLRPVIGLYDDLLVALVEDAREMSVELGVVDELAFPPSCRRRRHRPAVELVHSGRRDGAESEGEVEAVAVAPQVRANGQA